MCLPEAWLRWVWRAPDPCRWAPRATHRRARLQYFASHWHKLDCVCILLSLPALAPESLVAALTAGRSSGMFAALSAGSAPAPVLAALAANASSAAVDASGLSEAASESRHLLASASVGYVGAKIALRLSQVVRLLRLARLLRYATRASATGRSRSGGEL